MGQKVHPTGFRIGVIKGWQSRWFAERDYKDILAEDFLIRKLINKELANASVSRIEIERAAASQLTVIIFTARPGIVIGKSGEKVDKLRATLEAKTRKRVRLNIMEIRQPELDAYLVARSVAEQLEKRVSFRRAMKQAAQKTMRVNAKGIKIICGGRLGGAEIARSEKEVEGKVPLHTLRADIDYGFTEAHTTFGVIGVKVWIYKGDILPSKHLEPGETSAEATTATNFAPREHDTRERRGGDRRRSGERGPRPQGDQSRGGESGTRQGGERAPRPQGERSQRPQGDRPRGPRQPRPQGEQQGQPRAERPARPQGERAPRPQGERPQGDRPRAPRPPRQQPAAEAPVEQTPTDQAVSTEPVVQPAVQPETDTGATQSE